MTSNKAAVVWVAFCSLFGSLGSAQTLSLTLTGTAGRTTGNGFSMNGSATITGLGAAVLSGAGLLDDGLISGQTSAPIPGSLSFIFPDGAIMLGTFYIPAGILIPQIGGTISGVGFITITGGTGRFEGAYGRFEPITGVGVVTSSTTSTYTITGNGTLNVGQKVLPQLAFGGGWYTAVYFSNSNATAVSFSLNFLTDNGTPLNIPALGGSSTNVTIPAGGSVRMEVPNAGSLSQGYASMTLPPGVTGYGVFRQSVAGIADQEAVAPLSNAGTTASTLTFDDTDYITGAAIVNASAVATTVTITVKGANGGLLGSASLPLAAKSKTAVALRALTGLGAVANNRGTATFSVTTGSVAVLGLRFNGSAFTSIPTTEK